MSKIKISEDAYEGMRNKSKVEAMIAIAGSLHETEENGFLLSTTNNFLKEILLSISKDIEIT